MSSSRAISLSFLVPAVLLAGVSVAAQTRTLTPPPGSGDAFDAAHVPICDADHPDPRTEVFGHCSADLPEYTRVMQANVYRTWHSLVPADAWMKRACAVVDFTIRPDGGISALKIPRSTGDLQLDRAALGGIVSGSPFASTPAGCDRGINVRFRIYYNPGSAHRAIPTASPANRATAPDDEPVTRDKDIAPPVLAYAPNSEHAPVVLTGSDATAEDGRTGRVVLTAIVTSRGDVVSAKIVRSAGNGFDENAMASVVMSKFKPATLVGIPVRAEVTLRVDLQ
ncbi:MAG TPA: TonB family protein [Verrucomicrobiae bacterium]|nr:TonB family protein [Verrucomicrobiae bacterium]